MDLTKFEITYCVGEEGNVIPRGGLEGEIGKTEGGRGRDKERGREGRKGGGHFL